MGNNKFVAILAAILLITIAWYFWPEEQKRQLSKNLKTEHLDQHAEIIRQAKEVIDAERKLTPEERGELESVLSKLVSDSPKLSKIRTMQQASNRPIEFYGKVIDQHGDPVSNAKVSYSVLAYEGVVSFAGTPRNYRKHTDSQGRFLVSDIKGEDITMSDIEKAGYEFEFLNRTYHTFSQQVGHKPLSMGSQDKPVVFHGWEKSASESLVYNDILIGFSPSGKTYAIDLIKPKKVEGGASGDIMVSFSRPLNAKRNGEFSWSVTIEGIAGGLIETSDVFMNEAPQSGYQPIWKFEMEKGSPNYQAEVVRRFYCLRLGGLKPPASAGSF